MRDELRLLPAGTYHGSFTIEGDGFVEGRRYEVHAAVTLDDGAHRHRLRRHVAAVGRRDQRVVLADHVGGDLRGALPRGSDHPDERRLLPRGAHAAPTRDARQPEPAGRVRRARHQRDRGDRGGARRPRAGASRPSRRAQRAHPRVLAHGSRRRRSPVGEPVLRLRRYRRAPRRRRARRHRLLLPRRAVGDPADRAAGGAVPVRRPALAPAPRLRWRRPMARRARHRDRRRDARARRAHRARRPHRAPAARGRRRWCGRTRCVRGGARRRHDRGAVHQAGRHPPRRRRPLRHAHLGWRRPRATGGTRSATRSAPTCGAAGSRTRTPCATTASTHPTNEPTNESTARAGSWASTWAARSPTSCSPMPTATSTSTRCPPHPTTHASASSKASRHVLSGASVAPGDVSRVVHGTTLATNVILEQKGSPACLRRHRGLRRPAAAGPGSPGRGRPVRPLLHDARATGRPEPHVRSPRADQGRRQRAAGAVRRRRSATSPRRVAGGVDVGRRHLPAQRLRQPRARARSSHAPCARRAPGRVRRGVHRGVARDARVRARDDHGDVRVRRAGDGGLPRRPGSAARRARHRRSARDHGLERRRDVGVARGAPAGADARVRRRRGRDRGRSRRAAHRRTPT